MRNIDAIAFVMLHGGKVTREGDTVTATLEDGHALSWEITDSGDIRTDAFSTTADDRLFFGLTGATECEGIPDRDEAMIRGWIARVRRRWWWESEILMTYGPDPKDRDLNPTLVVSGRYILPGPVDDPEALAIAFDVFHGDTPCSILADWVVDRRGRFVCR